MRGDPADLETVRPAFDGVRSMMLIPHLGCDADIGATARAAGVDHVVLDVTGGDVNAELLRVRETVAQITGSPARPFRRWAEENTDAFR